MKTYNFTSKSDIKYTFDSLPRKNPVLSIIFRTFYYRSSLGHGSSLPATPGGGDFLSVYPATPSNIADCSRFNSFSRSIFIYRFMPHWVPAICRSLAAASIRALLPSGIASMTYMYCASSKLFHVSVVGKARRRRPLASCRILKNGPMKTSEMPANAIYPYV